MKKKIVVSLMAIILFTFSAQLLKVSAVFGQWSNDGSVIYYNDGYVGIGTSSPVNKLDVRGSAIIGGGHLRFADSGGVIYPDNWIGMADSIEGSKKWLHIGGITDSGIGGDNLRRIGLFANKVYMNGSLGINTISPQGKLDVKGDVYIGNGVDNNSITLRGPGAPTGYGSIQNIKWDFASAGGAVIRAYRGASWDTYMQFLTNDNSGSYDPRIRMHINSNGNVGIGTIFPTKTLSVNGTVLAKEVIVSTASSNWPDYVFSDDYKLMSIEEVEQYISKNKHLPGINSASSVSAEGISLGEMQNKQMEKIEELTLYLIDLQKEVKALKEELSILKK